MDAPSERGFAPAGEYAGLVPARLWLLGCDCGEVGCWPLEADVVLTDHQVTWSGFAQPHRPAWSYAGVGPFVFDRRQYEDAVATSAALVHP
ncbi:hypothetical protein [Cellulomonas hominis]|uniref:hypothetical protein n=1 Tax=Cellulomonas hominis TaxID=156981 RepID=UPI001BA09E66|nr:hypothetical protein [Cellulomonas hominis]VTR76625.1 hypothetical protein CHMI_01387 [Cellulomonas hominis]